MFLYLRIIQIMSIWYSLLYESIINNFFKSRFITLKKKKFFFLKVIIFKKKKNN